MAPIAKLNMVEKQQDLRLAPKLCEADLITKGCARMKVGPAARVLSHTVASAIRYLNDSIYTFMPPNTEATDHL